MPTTQSETPRELNHTGSILVQQIESSSFGALPPITHQYQQTLELNAISVEDMRHAPLVDAALLATQNQANLYQFNLMRNYKPKQRVLTRSGSKKTVRTEKRKKENVDPKQKALRPRGRPRRQVVSSEPSEVASDCSDGEYTVGDWSSSTVKTQTALQVRSPYNIRRKN